MTDIYATPEADVTPRVSGARAGGNVEDAIEGNIEVRILDTMGEAWRIMKGFKLKCHVATVIWFLVYLVAILVIFPIMLGLGAIGADEVTAAIVGQVLQFVAISATMPMIVGITIMGIRHAQGKQISAGSIFNHFHRAPAAILCYFLMVVMILFGYLLLILPGIYLSFAYMYALPLVVEKDMGAWRALETSRKAITRMWFRATGFLLLISLLLGLGTIPLGIPLIWFVPWLTLAYALVYFKLFGAEARTLAD